MDLLEVCRLCCEKKSRMHSIFEEQGNEKLALRQIFSDVLRLEVYFNDGLPQNICKLCIVTLTKLHETVEGYRQNDLMLRKELLGVANIEIKEEEEEMEVERLEEAFTQELTVYTDDEHSEIKQEIEDQVESDVPSQDHESEEWLPADDECREYEEDDEQDPEPEAEDNGKLHEIVLDADKDRSKKPGMKKKTKTGTDQSAKKGRIGRRRTIFLDPNRPRLNDFKCYICKSESMGSAEALFTHLSSHSNEVPTTCKICVMETIKLRTVSMLNNHKRMHQNAHKCPYCDRRYNHPSAVDQHLQRYHLGDNAPCPSPCDICGKVCPSRLSLHDHQRLHTRAVSCELCGKVFMERHKLKRHIERVHQKIRKFECHVCHKKLQSTDSLQNHINTMHSDKIYECSYCPKSYTSELTWRIHEKKHVEDPTYKISKDWKQYYTVTEGENGARIKKCNFCGLVTKGITVHLATHFPQEFRCDRCDMVFKQKKRYEIHMKVHEQGKEYLCPICGKEFALKILLRVHLRTKKHLDHPLALDWFNKNPKQNKNKSKKFKQVATQNEEMKAVEVIKHILDE